MNPLLDLSALPHFSAIRPAHIEPAIDQVLKQNREQLQQLLQAHNVYTWDNLIAPLQQMESRLDRVWSPVRHLNSVMNSEALRKAHDACVPKLSEYSTELSQNERLYQAYKAIKLSVEFNQFNEAQKQCIENALINFELGGVALNENNKKQFKQLRQTLSTLTTEFSQHILDATHTWKKHISDPSELAGLPDFALDMLAQNAEQDGLDGYLVTLDFPSFNAIMTYAGNRQLRQEVYRAYVTRASELGDEKFNNSALMDKILEHRLQIAHLLGFKNYAEYSIRKKMVEHTHDVLDFLYELNKKSRPMAEDEYRELVDFAEQTDQLNDFQAWDTAYYAEKHKQQLFKFSQQDLKPYFPANKVIQGLFGIVKRLYGIEISRHNGVDVWHDDVHFYEIKDKAGQLRGQFYLDLYARKNKQGGAWMDECINRMRDKETNEIQTPVAYLTCNLTPPVGKKPALFDHNEVITLFHEFGHGLHHMLTLVDEYDVSGINGVEWDAVELPSQFMENWCWQKESLSLISGHYETGACIPDDLFEKMLAAKNYRAASMMIRQLEFALFDFELHLNYGTEYYQNVQSTLDHVREKVAVAPTPEFNRFQHSFSHIFAGGYAAGYYSYKWAEVLSADAFSKFEDEGLFNQQTGQAFLHQILEKGGARKAIESFKAFMGREPEVDALLRHNGLLAS